MMKIIIFLISFIGIGLTQRPYYAGLSPKGYPEVASRFRGNETSSTPAVVNRVGEADGTTPKIPVDARGDQDLINRLNTWPKENRPFWLLNAEHIEAHRNATGNNNNPSTNNQQTLNTRAGFAGGLSTNVNNNNQRPIVAGQPTIRPSFAGGIPENKPIEQRQPVTDGAAIIIEQPSEAPINNMITGRRSRVNHNNEGFLRKQRSDHETPYDYDYHYLRL